MAKNYLKRHFTTREIVFLVILLVVLLIGLYFGLVFYPIQARVADLNAQREQLEFNMDVANARKAEYDNMKKELERIAASGDTTIMPLYKNNEQQEVLHACFQAIVGGLQERANISFATPSENDGVYSRNVSFSFRVTEADTEPGQTVYEKTRSILTALLTTGYRCLMTSLTFTPSGGDLLNGDVGVSTTIVFYELA